MAPFADLMAICSPRAAKFKQVTLSPTPENWIWNLVSDIDRLNTEADRARLAGEREPAVPAVLAVLEQAPDEPRSAGPERELHDVPDGLR